jgi:hypothetical protein
LNLLGSLLVSHLQLVAMARSELAPEKRTPFFVHVDEFQNFSTDSFASLLSEARKFACLANQYLEQIALNVRMEVHRFLPTQVEASASKAIQLFQRQTLKH